VLIPPVSLFHLLVKLFAGYWLDVSQQALDAILIRNHGNILPSHCPAPAIAANRAEGFLEPV